MNLRSIIRIFRKIRQTTTRVEFKEIQITFFRGFRTLRIVCLRLTDVELGFRVLIAGNGGMS